MAQPGGSFSDSISGKASRTLPVTVRRATIKDLDTIVKIWIDGVQIAQGLTPPNHDEISKLFKTRIESQSGGFGVWVAEVDGAVAGWQSLQPCRPNPMMRWAESSTYISMQHLGQGIGGALTKFATEHARFTTLTHVVGFIPSRNEPMIKIAESCGWQKVGSIPRSKSSDPEYSYYVYPVPQQ
jgi:L-amino acid N-acyltransferase YncA